MSGFDLYDVTGGMSPVEIGGSLYRNKSAKAPEGFNWPESLPEVIAYKSGNQYDCNLKPEDLIDFSQFTNIIYVDISASSDGDGLSWATARKGIGQAISQAQSSGIASRILVKSGDYYRQYSVCDNNTVKSLTVPICIESVYGRSKVGVYDNLSWSSNATHSHVYEATRSNAQFAYIPANNGGTPEILETVESLSDCAATPNSFYTDNVKVYIHASGDEVVSNSTHRVTVDAKGASFYSNQPIYFKGFDFYGGNSGCFSINQGSTNKVVHEECNAFIAASGQSASLTPIDGFQIFGCGMFAAFNCESSKNGKDGFNIHKNGSVIPSGLFVNCKGFKNGIIPTSTSNNGITMHDGVKCIDIGGDWRGSIGTNAGHVSDGTQVWHFGSVAGDSAGDVYNGGSIDYGAFGVWSGAAEMWLDSCRSVGSIVSVKADGDAHAYVRDFSGTGSLSGNVSEY